MNELVQVQISDELQLVDEMPSLVLEKLAELGERVLAYLNTEAGVSIVIADDAFVHELNLSHRGVDATTDVLSFAAEALPDEIELDEAPYLGDLIIAYHYTLAQALAAGHKADDEFGLLVVHGILHLVGYDHNTEAEQKIMWQKQAELLQLLGIDIVVPDFVHGLDD